MNMIYIELLNISLVNVEIYLLTVLHKLIYFPGYNQAMCSYYRWPLFSHTMPQQNWGEPNPRNLPC